MAVADLATERARLVGAMFGLKEDACFTEAQRLIERNDIDAVSIATPPNIRTELVALAAASGKHVICEKPLATTLAAGDEMIECCARFGVQLFVYHNYLYFPETRLARKLIGAGEIGEVLATAGDRLRRSPLGGDRGVCSWMAPRCQPRWRRGLDGRRCSRDLFDGGLPWPIRRQGQCRRSIRRQRCGRRGLLPFRSWSGHRPARCRLGTGGASLSIMGDAGHISFVFDEHMGYYGAPARAVRLFPAGGPSRSWYMPVVRTFFTPELFEDIAATIEGTDNRYPARGEDARRAVEVVFAAYRSAATQAVVELPLQRDTLYNKGLAGLQEARSSPT